MRLTDAPLYIRAQSLAVWLHAGARRRPGADLLLWRADACTRARRLATLFALALTFPDRRALHLRRADEALVALRETLRIACQAGDLDEAALRHAGGELAELGRMLGGWRKREARRLTRALPVCPSRAGEPLAPAREAEPTSVEDAPEVHRGRSRRAPKAWPTRAGRSMKNGPNSTLKRRAETATIAPSVAGPTGTTPTGVAPRTGTRTTRRTTGTTRVSGSSAPPPAPPAAAHSPSPEQAPR